MGEEREISMVLCRRVDGVVKCVRDGFRATYEDGTVGPVRLRMRDIYGRWI